MMKKATLFVLIICYVYVFPFKTLAQSCYRGNPQHTGCYTDPGPGTKISLAWKFHTQGRVISSPAVTNSLVVTGSDDSSVYALDRSTGALVWKFKTGGRVSSSPAVSGNRVYFNSFDGYVYALNVRNGRLIWKFNMGGDRVFSAPHLHGVDTHGNVVKDPWDMYLSSPVLGAGRLYVGSGNGNVYALDAKNGKLVWKFKTNGVVHVSPAFSGDSLYFASWDSYIYAVNAVNGMEYWKFKTGTDTMNFNQVGFQSSPAVSGRRLFLGCRDAHMRAIDRFTGKLLWQFSTQGSWIIGSPALCKGRVYFGTSDTHRMLALNAVTGSVIFDGHAARSYIFSSPAVAGARLFVGTFGGFLYEMNCTNGKLQPVFRTEGSVVNGTKYLNSDSTIRSNAVFTDPAWKGMLEGVKRLYTLGSVLSSPVISGNEIFFGSTDGSVYALK